MDDYFQANRELWDQWTGQHEQSSFYDVAGFKAGKERLNSIELTELGDVHGKTLLHLQCHFGLDTLAWARHGAAVTGVDFSEPAIALAQSLSRELNIPAQFYCSDISRLPDHLSGEFDIIFTSYGVLHWLNDLRRWAEVIAYFLKPGGIFYIVEDHPFMRVFDAGDEQHLRAAFPYFFTETPDKLENMSSYASDGQAQTTTFYNWNHSLSEVINTLLEAGLQLEFLHEFPFASRSKFPGMVEGEDKWWRFTDQRHEMVPMLFSLQARKPG